MKKFSIMCLFVVSNFLYSQNTYIDVTTTLALKLYSDNLKKKQNETIKEQTKLKQAQTWVGLQIRQVEKIQEKMLKGLREVSGTLQNGIQVVGIYNELEQCQQYSSEIASLVAQKPLYAVFGVKTSQKTYEQALKIGTDVMDILESGELNLATAGDRYRLLFQISQNVISLKLWLIETKLVLERAIRLGFWNSINPFQGYINLDKDIVDNIMWKFKHQF